MTHNRLEFERHLPHGLSDLLYAEAAQRVQLETKLSVAFQRWGYTQVIPPTFEFYESIAAETGARMREELYRFFDRDGRTLALRADFTIPIARIVATKLYDQPMPLRFYYVGSVFRYEEPRAGQQREFTQAGIELIGARTPAADAEAIALVGEALRTSGVRDFRINVGQMAYFKALIADLSLDATQVIQLKEAIERRASAQLQQVLQPLPISAERKNIFAQLIRWQHRPDWLTQARALCVNEPTHAALDELHAVLQQLAAFDGDLTLRVDLTELRGMEYYTGIVFEGFIPGVGYAVVSGGRYDELTGHYGKDLPAIGFAISVERVMRGLALPPPPLMPPIVAEACGHPACIARIRQARRAGHNVLMDVRGRRGAELRAYAQQIGATQVLDCALTSPA